MGQLRNEIFEWVKTLVVVLILVIIVRTFFFANYMVYGESMMPSIQDGERIIINKASYNLSEPKRFDMIVFHATKENDYIKRVIGLPGDSIYYKDDILYVNDVPIEEAYLEEFRAQYDGNVFTNDFTIEDVTNESVVPEGHLFVLGDNRRNSMDSRQLGFISLDQVVGKANLCYWPLSDFRLLK
ncbi:signal peptidase I [Desertibacillus haloalkaliphilus]|uniref:signal peptidase I n=1 Tax=Desertibacillus haloalkaliphilus TaxID=1328930 RepID=UPI001C2785E1|nr:signal peptidase I [Desertibacillus haloalkaliphilus]MBU8908929.1 signal peptidase I [Desertibacillus haloalkaliphilus]